MQKLLENINSIPPEIKRTINSRLNEFASFSSKSSKEWFSELCFCLLTANSKAKTALAIQRDLGFEGFYNLNLGKLVNEIKSHKHRFHNIKSARIVEARKFIDIKSIIQNQKDEVQARLWLVKNVNGLGLKEASHFLRNTGHENLAIIDRHIINLLKEHNLLESDFNVKNASSYIYAEQVCERIAKSINMSLSKLDLSLWYLKTREVLK